MSVPVLDNEVDQLNALVAYLDTYAKPNGAQTAGLENMAHLWEHVRELAGTDQPRILVACNGEDRRRVHNDDNSSTRVDRKWVVVVMSSKGWKSQLAEPGVEATSKPFLQVIKDLRNLLRVTQNLSWEFPIDYRGWKPLPNLAPGPAANVFLDAAMLEFSTANEIGIALREAPPAA